MNDVIYAAQHPSGHAGPLQPQDCWLFFYCTGGAADCITDTLTQTCTPGSMLVLPPEAASATLNLHRAQGILLCMREPPLVFRQPYLLPDDANHSLMHLMQDALWHYSAATPDTGALLSAYGQLITQHVNLRRPAAPQSQLVEDLARSITQNYANPNYELDEQLRSAPYCYDYLCRLFKQEMHTTPHKYLANLRLQAAADILRAGASSSITEIARMCGYHDPLYFSRMFKKKFGLSPREYVKSAGQ